MMKQLRISPLFLAIFAFLLVLEMSGCGRGGGDEVPGPPPGGGSAANSAAPSILSAFPAGGATDVATESTIIVTFSSEMDPATLTPATFMLETASQRMAGTISYSGKIATFSPSVPLASRGIHRVTVTNGVKDTAGRPLKENFSWEFTAAAAPDIQPPVVSKTLPADEAVEVAINTAVSATFSEEINPETVHASTALLHAEGNAVSFTPQLSGKTVTFVLGSDLKPDTNYTATLTTGVEDVAGNRLSENYSWTFRAGSRVDTTGPLVLNTKPENQATEVAVDQPITAVFNEVMDVSSIHSTTLTLTTEGAPVSGLISYSGTTAMIIPAENLKNGATYQAAITPGVRDAAGNPMAAERTWTFTTERLEQTTPPRVVSTRPRGGETGIVITGPVSAVFDHAIDPTTVNERTFFIKKLGDSALAPGKVTYDPNTKSVYFTPQEELFPSTTYQAVLTTGIQDTSGNILSSDHVWTFTTERPQIFLSVAPSVITFMATPTGPPPIPQRLTITDKAGREVDWSLSADVSWLSLTPSTGKGSSTATVDVKSPRLTVGIHQGRVTIAAPRAEVSPGKVPIQYMVADSAACMGRTRKPYIAFATPSSATLGWECAPQAKIEWGIVAFSGTTPIFSSSLCRF